MRAAAGDTETDMNLKPQMNCYAMRKETAAMRRIIGFLVVLALVTVYSTPGSAGTLVVANKSEATVSLVDTGSGEILATLPTGNAPHEVAVSPNGMLALVGNYGTRDEPGSSLTVIDVGNAQVVKTIELEGYTRPHGIVWLNDEIALTTAEDQQALLRVNITDGKVEQAISTDAEISHMVAVAREHGLAFVANIGSGSVTVIDLALGVRVDTVPSGEGAEGIAVTPNGRQVWVTNRAEDTISVLNATGRKVVAKIEAGEFPIRAEATADGRFVLVTNAKGNDLSVFSTADMKEIGRVSFTQVSKGDDERLFSDRFGDSSVPIGIEIVDSEKRAYVAHANADDISIIDLVGGKVVGTLSAGKEPDGMGWSPLTPTDEVAPAQD
jgi:YVTN family beta-propeller protein